MSNGQQLAVGSWQLAVAPSPLQPHPWQVCIAGILPGVSEAWLPAGRARGAFCPGQFPPLPAACSSPRPGQEKVIEAAERCPLPAHPAHFARLDRTRFCHLAFSLAWLADLVLSDWQTSSCLHSNSGARPGGPYSRRWLYCHASLGLQFGQLHTQPLQSASLRLQPCADATPRPRGARPPKSRSTVLPAQHAAYHPLEHSFRLHAPPATPGAHSEALQQITRLSVSWTQCQPFVGWKQRPIHTFGQIFSCLLFSQELLLLFTVACQCIGKHGPGGAAKAALGKRLATLAMACRPSDFPAAALTYFASAAAASAAARRVAIMLSTSSLDRRNASNSAPCAARASK